MNETVFEQQWNQFAEEQGAQLPQTRPQVVQKEINLYRFYLACMMRGGHSQVTQRT